MASSRRGVNGNQSEVVLTEELAAVITDWVERWRKERPSHEQMAPKNGGWRATEHAYLGAFAYIEIHSGIPERATRRITRLETKYTSLAIADLILLAIDRQFLLGSAIKVIPNPRWNKKTLQARGLCLTEQD